MRSPAPIIPAWPRPHFQRPGGQPNLFYIVYGRFAELTGLCASQYRSTGIPAGMDLHCYNAQEHPDIFIRFQEGHVWDELLASDAALARQIARSPECVILRGEIDDSDNLNYLRDSVGLLTFLLDRGGVALYDPMMFRWWAPEAWRQEVFVPAQPLPERHVVILTSKESEPSSTWYHTRGMRKFGRPDLSVRNVPVRYQDAIIDLCGRFIELQALGGIVEEGQEIRMRTLPKGMVCHHAGAVDDPDFNNVHIEISWQHERN